jgi:hypothetical protein
MWSLAVLWFVSFLSLLSLAIFTLFFSNIIAGSSTKRTFYKTGFLVAFSGVATGTAFALAVPILPSFIPVMDMGVVFTAVVWVFSLRRFGGTDWSESLLTAFIATIIYIVIMAIASNVSMLMPWEEGYRF